MEAFIIGIVVAANIIFILYKVKKQRYSDAILDFILLALVTVVFMGSYAGLVVGTVASLVVSIYLYRNPPTINFDKSLPESNDVFEEFKRRAKRRYE